MCLSGVGPSRPRAHSAKIQRCGRVWWFEGCKVAKGLEQRQQLTGESGNLEHIYVGVGCDLVGFVFS